MISVFILRIVYEFVLNKFYPKFKYIIVEEKTGEIPENHVLVVTERGSEIPSAIWLCGFDEVGLFDHLMKSPPVYGFIGDA